MGYSDLIPVAFAVLSSLVTSYIITRDTALRNSINISNLANRFDRLEKECCSDTKNIADRLTQVETTVGHLKDNIRENFDSIKSDMKDLTHELHSVNKNLKHERVT